MTSRRRSAHGLRAAPAPGVDGGGGRGSPAVGPRALRPVEVRVSSRPVSRFAEVMEATQLESVMRTLREASARLRGRVVWHVSSTVRGGGVAEMMGPLIGYARDAGTDARWIVIAGTDEFFALTKRVHNHLHADPGDGGPLGAAQRAMYERVLRENAAELAAVVRAGDVVVLHDPQTAGLAPLMRRLGALVVWRCHIGHEDLLDPHVAEGWSFLEPYLREVDATVFSRAAYVPACCRAGRAEVIRPSIDPFSAKNQALGPATTRAILVQAGLVEGPLRGEAPIFTREDGAPGRVDRGADILRVGRAPRWDVPLVVQVSRWDRLKDHLGVMRGFVRMAAEADGASLVLAGPAVTAVADDPDGPAVLGEVTEAWRALAHEDRRRVQLVALPMVDRQENAAMVNALQRHAAVVVQKSLQEGFGLTVTEAMWKSRPVVASAVGGIPEQLEDGREGLLVADPADTDAVAAALRRLLGDRAEARRLGDAAHERVRAQFLAVRQLADYARLIEALLA